MKQTTQKIPLPAEEMEERLDEHVDAVLSSRRTAEQPAMELSRLRREQQEFVLHWVAATAQTHAEMAYQFAALARTAMEHMDNEGIEAWIIQAMDSFDKKGLGASIAQLQKVEEFAQERQKRTTGLALEDISGVLQHFILGLNGRHLHLVAGEQTYTDTQTLFVPGLINRFATREKNFRLCKAFVVHLWAQTWYGTWRIDLAQLTEKLPQKDRRIRMFHALETLRLDACIHRDLPGLYREMRDLRKTLNPQPFPVRWPALRQRLQSAQADARTSWELVSSVYDDPIPTPFCYQGQLFPQRVREAGENRKGSEKGAFRIALAKLRDDLNEKAKQGPLDSPLEDKITPAPFKLKRVESNDLPQGFSYELQLGDRPVHPPDDVRGIMASIVRDLGEIPEDYLVAAGPGAYDGSARSQDLDPNDVWKGTYHERGAFLYNEWDYARQHYRKNWCVLREQDVHPQFNDFVPATLNKYSGLVKSLRRSFEALRGEDKLLKKQPYGDDIDINALVEAHTDVKSGREMSNRVFLKRHKEERNIAVMFMVDMSGSNQGLDQRR